MNPYKEAQLQRFNKVMLPLLNDPKGIKDTNIPKIIRLRDTFDPSIFPWFFEKMPAPTYTIVFKNFFEAMLRQISNKGIIPFKYQRSRGDYGLQDYYVIAKLTKGKNKKEIRYLSYNKNFISAAKGTLYDPNAPDSLITIFGIIDHPFLGPYEEDFVEYGLSWHKIDYYTFNILTLNVGDHFKNKVYNYYIESTTVTKIETPPPRSIGIRDKNGVDIKEFDRVRVKIVDENEVITTISLGNGFGKKMVSIPSSKSQGVHYNLLSCFPEQVEYIEVLKK